MAITRPNLDQMAEIAASLGMNMDDAEVAFFLENMQGTFDSYDALDEMPDEIPAVKYPRTPGYRPGPDENPHNAWYWKSEIKGAATGKLAGKTVAMVQVDGMDRALLAVADTIKPGAVGNQGVGAQELHLPDRPGLGQQLHDSVLHRESGGGEKDEGDGGSVLHHPLRPGRGGPGAPLSDKAGRGRDRSLKAVYGRLQFGITPHSSTDPRNSLPSNAQGCLSTSTNRVSCAHDVDPGKS